MEQHSTLNPADSLLNAAKTLRDKTLNLNDHSIRLAALSNTDQTGDIRRPIILEGFGRIHCFSELKQGDWITDPLPTIPASKKLGYPPELVRDARVLQLSACNLRCWYCFVDYESLSPDSPLSKEFRISEIITLINDSGRKTPFVLDLSGGNPGLVPEWIWWTITELKNKCIDNIYLWADDNLTVDFYSTYLDRDQIEDISTYHLFGSVGCFKGFDELSFSLNTGLRGDVFNDQFRIFKSLFSFGWDIYAYVTFTTHIDKDLHGRMSSFVDKLQEIDPNLPLKTIPLEIRPYTPTKARINPSRERSLEIQYEVLHFWNEELNRRFDPNLRTKPICDIPYVSRG